VTFISTQEIKVESYRFFNFRLAGNATVLFNVAIIEGRDFNGTDSQKVTGILNGLGKWEILIKGGLNVLSDLRIIQIEPSVLQSFERSCGIELYEVNIQRGRLGVQLECGIHIKPEERRRREQLNISPVLTVEEITSQLSNIPKWKAFEKTMKIIKEQWSAQ
jgi:hypothetical protein